MHRDAIFGCGLCIFIFSPVIRDFDRRESSAVRKKKKKKANRWLAVYNYDMKKETENNKGSFVWPQWSPQDIEENNL